MRKLPLSWRAKTPGRYDWLLRRNALALLPILLVFGLGCGSLQMRSSAPSVATEDGSRLAHPVDLGQYFAWKTEQRSKGAQRRLNQPDMRPRYPDKAWDWFYSRRVSFDTLSIPVDYREQALTHTRLQAPLRIDADAQAVWSPAGPYPPRGRLTDLAVHPGNDQILYAASAGGGVWKTSDQGRSWTNLTDNKIPSLGIGSLVMSPDNPDTLYIGLGEGLYSVLYDPLGMGVYRTTDGGANWTLTPGSGDRKMQVTVALEFGENAQTLYAGCLGVSGAEGLEGHGFFKTTDSGATWTRLREVRCWSISVHPTSPNDLVITTDEGGASPGRIYYSTNGGATLTASTIPTGASPQRIELVRAPSAPQTLYALAGATNSSLAGIWKSTDGGRVWSALSQTGIVTSDHEPSQMNYNNCIAVAPNDANTVYFGSNLRPYKSTDGGANWKSMAYWFTPNEFNLPYVHADHHAIAFGASPNTVFFGTDGGFHVSFDGGVTWEERNDGLLITQIYRLSNPGTNPNQQLIGCQDNSMYVRKLTGEWEYIKWFGDGFECIVDDKNNNYVYGTGYYGSSILFSHSRGENATGWFYLRGFQEINNGIPDNEQGAWVIPFIQDPVVPGTLYVGLTNIYKATMEHVTPDQNPKMPAWVKLTDGAGAPHNMEVIRVSYGPQNRKMFFFTSRYFQQTGAWEVGLTRMNLDGTQRQALTMPRIGFVNDIACDPNNNDTVWICYSDIGASPGAKSRIYRSTNLGDSWTDMTGNLPQTLPISAIWIDPNRSETMILGTDLGCYRSDDGGQRWYPFNNGLPNVVVTDIAFHQPSRVLRVATYGRGVWETPVDGLQGEPRARIAPTTLTYP